MAAKKKVEEETNPLAGKTVRELQNMRADALFEESEAKRYLVLLRQRAANMASTIGPEVDQEIIRAKAEQAKAESWLKQIEKELEGEFKDIYGTK